MKNHFKALLGIWLILLCQVVEASSFRLGFPLAIASTANFDIQTGGADTNAGCFDPSVANPGTDESQGAGTAITITLTGTGTTGTGSPAFTSTTHGPGNCILIASGSGCSTGLYELNSQASGTGTFDRAMGSSGNVCVGVIGGPLLTISKFYSSAVNGNIGHLKAGTYTITSSLGNTTLQNYALIGYQTSHHTISNCEAQSDTRPLITSSTNSVNIFNNGPNASNYTMFCNITVNSTAATKGDCFHATNTWVGLTIANSKLSGCNVLVNGEDQVDFPMQYLAIRSSELTGSVSHCIINTEGGIFKNNYIHGCGGDGFTFGAHSAVGGWYAQFIGNVIVSNVHGINATHGLAAATAGPQLDLHNNTIANNSSDGVTIATSLLGAASLSMDCNLVYGNTGWGVNAPSSPGAIMLNRTNAYGSNGSGNINNLAAGNGDVTLSAGPFTNSGGGDYSLNNTAGGGAAARGACWPGAFPAGTTTGGLDIGAVQSAAAAAPSYGFPIFH
jgi:hypothetical protein